MKWDMNLIEKKITEKYRDTDYGRYNRLMRKYWKVKHSLQYLPKMFASTYLCLRFPFLKYALSYDSEGRKVNKRFFQPTCWYWQIEEGWRKAFGIQLCKELKDALKRGGMLHTWNITDIKEKYGSLQIYDDGATEEVHDIINKYDYISSRTCIVCGRGAKYRTKGWEKPYCEEHLPEGSSADEYYKDFNWYGWTR